MPRRRPRSALSSVSSDPPPFGPGPRSRRIALCAALLCFLAAPPAAEADGADKRIAKQLEALGRKYKIEIVVPKETFRTQSTHGVIDGVAARAEELAGYRPILLEEFARYPVGFLRKAGLRRFVLCSKLSFSKQMRYAIPDFPHDTMYLSVERPDWYAADTREQFEHYLRKVFHHELFHLIDWKDDGLLYRDDAWVKLNPPAFQYGKGGVNMRDDPTVSMITDKIPGFVSGYSTAGVEEDKAEIYANLMANTAALAERAHADPIVAKKVEAMVRLLDAYSETAPQLLAGVVPLVGLPLRFVHARTTSDGGKPRCVALEAARERASPILIYVRRRAWRRATKGEAKQARATAKLEAGFLRDKKVVEALAGWSLISLDLGSRAADKLASSLGARKAPKLLIWRSGAERPKRVPLSADAAGLVRALQRVPAAAK